MAERAVLLLDAELRHSIAIARSLGRRGIPVVAASRKRRFPTAYSRHVQATVHLSPGAELDSVLRAVDQHAVGAVIPAGLAGNHLLCSARDALESKVAAPFNELAAFNRLSNKHATAELAEELGVPYPATAELRSIEDAADVAERIGFPMVFKSPVDQGTVRYPRTVSELSHLVAGFLGANRELTQQGIYPLAQQYIAGDAHGFYGLADHGELRADFMHKRLHQVPPTGGPSAMAISYRDPRLREVAEPFFTATGWNGVAMVEFKKSRDDGAYYLLEVNPKFWGSLDLSILAGVDFPYLLYQMLLSGSSLDGGPPAYRDGAVFRWLTLDLAYAAAVGDYRGYLRRFRNPQVADDFDSEDPLPTAALFVTGVARMAGGSFPFLRGREE